jgi:hypothetical protein
LLIGSEFSGIEKRGAEDMIIPRSPVEITNNAK